MKRTNKGVTGDKADEGDKTILRKVYKFDVDLTKKKKKSIVSINLCNFLNFVGFCKIRDS